MEPATERTKAVFKRMIFLYRDNDLLWDQKHAKYLNHPARYEAYEKILDVYRKVEPHANVVKLKKKLDNFRATFKREHKKVQASIAEGGEVYQPSLWYYNYLTFLADGQEPSTRVKHSDDDEFDVEHLEEDLDDATNEVLTYYSENQDDDEEDSVKAEVHTDPFDDTEDVDEFDEPPKRSRPSKRPSPPTRSARSECPAEAFGRSVSAQLKECDRVQRCIAEKLISEVICCAKLGHLSLEAKLELKSHK